MVFEGNASGMREAVEALEAATQTGSFEWWPAEDRLVWSPGLLRIYGLNRAPSAEDGFSQLLHPDDRVRVEGETSTYLGSDVITYSHSFRIVRPDGAVRYVLDQGIIERDDLGQPRVIRGLNVDLTDFPHLDKLALASQGRRYSRGEGLSSEAPARVAHPPSGEEQLQYRMRQLDLMSRTSRRLLVDAGCELSLLETVFNDIADTIGVESWYHYRPIEPQLLGLALAAGVGETERQLFATMTFGDLLCGRVAESRTRLIVEDLQHCVQPGAHVLRGAGATSYAGFPLVVSGHLVGTVAFVTRQLTHFRDGDIQAVQSICDQVAIMIERRRLQRELEESRQRLSHQLAEMEALYSEAPVGLGLLDRELRFVRLNAALAETNGVPSQEHVGRTAWEVLPDLRRSAEPALQRVLATGEPLRDVVVTAETPAQPGVRREWREHFYPIRQQESVTGIGIICEEVTAHVTAARALAESEARHRTLIQATSSITWSCPPSGIHVEPQPEWMAFTGQSADEMLGDGWTKAVHPDDLPAASTSWHEAVARGAPFHNEMRVRRHDGEWRWMRVDAAPIRDASGEVTAWFGMNIDITERKKADEHIKLLMREVNHRAKNVLGLVQSIARQTASSSADNFLPRFEQRLQSLAAAQDLLVKHEWRSVPLVDLVASQLSHFADLFGSRIKVAGPELSLTASASQSIGLALHELATNAAKYGALSNATGSVSVAWDVMADTDAAARVTLSWSEQGGPAVSEPKRLGFGSTVTTSMLRYGVDGEVTTEYAAGGLKWRLICPTEHVLDTAPVPYRARPVPSRPVDLERRNSGRRVLVAEDEPLIAADISQMLEDADFYVVGPAFRSQHALALLETEGCDAAVLDVNLGKETSEPIARELVAAGKPFVVVSGYLQAQLPELLRAAPLVGKPLRHGALQTEVERCLGLVDR